MAILIIIISIFVGILLWQVHKRRIARQQQLILQAKVAQATEYVKPVLEKAYEQLTEEISSKWPLIPFDFPTLDSLLVNSKNILLRYSYQDIGRMAKRILNPIVSKAVADFISKNADFAAIGEITVKNDIASFFIDDDQAITRGNAHYPPDWTERRRIVYGRDGGHCRRCGVDIPLDKCHIHHVVKKSKGGGHSLDNLVTLCRDCHSLMPEHEIVTGGPFYARSYRGTLHTRECYHAIGATQLSGSLSYLIAQGYTPCSKCIPTTRGTLWIERFARARLSLIVNSLVLEHINESHTTSQEFNRAGKALAKSNRTGYRFNPNNPAAAIFILAAQN